jgi:hypothetical protein
MKVSLAGCVMLNPQGVRIPRLAPVRKSLSGLLLESRAGFANCRIARKSGRDPEETYKRVRLHLSVDRFRVADNSMHCTLRSDYWIKWLRC